MAFDDPNEPWPGFNAPRDAADAVMQDRVRVSAILDSAEGKRNPTMARKLALERGMDTAGALDILAAMPNDENPLASSDNPYKAALDREADITIGGTVSAISGDPKAQRLAEIKRAAGDWNASRGYVRQDSPTRRGA